MYSGEELGEIYAVCQETGLPLFIDGARMGYGLAADETLTLADYAKLCDVFYIGGTKCGFLFGEAVVALKERYPEIIVVGIEPAVALAAEQFPGGKIGVMATPATLKGKRFLENKAKFDSVCSVTPLPAPGLMELVEAGKSDTAEADAFLKELLKPYLGQLDALVLGCTHYPFVENALRRVAGENVKLFDGAVVTAQQTKDALEAAGLLHDGSGEVIFQNSLPGEKMLTLSRQLAGME